MAGKKDGKPPKATGSKATGPKNAGPEAATKATGSEKGADRRVARLRDKLTDAMQDPLTREQIVRAIRAMMQEK